MTNVSSKQATAVAAGEGGPLHVLGHIINIMLGSAETQGNHFAFEVITPAGQVVPQHVHEHEDEYGYIVEGVWEATLDGRTCEVRPGAVIYCPRCTSHGFRNIGPTTGRMIWFANPGANDEHTFTELGELFSDVPPDMQKVVNIFGNHGIQVLPPMPR